VSPAREQTFFPSQFFQVRSVFCHWARADVHSYLVFDYERSGVNFCPFLSSFFFIGIGRVLA
jgi:hypothetical protein